MKNLTEQEAIEIFVSQLEVGNEPSLYPYLHNPSNNPLPSTSEGGFDLSELRVKRPVTYWESIIAAKDLRLPIMDAQGRPLPVEAVKAMARSKFNFSKDGSSWVELARPILVSAFLSDMENWYPMYLLRVDMLELNVFTLSGSLFLPDAKEYNTNQIQMISEEKQATLGEASVDTSLISINETIEHLPKEMYVWTEIEGRSEGKVMLVVQLDPRASYPVKAIDLEQKETYYTSTEEVHLESHEYCKPV